MRHSYQTSLRLPSGTLFWRKLMAHGPLSSPKRLGRRRRLPILTPSMVSRSFRCSFQFALLKVKVSGVPWASTTRWRLRPQMRCFLNSRSGLVPFFRLHYAGLMVGIVEVQFAFAVRLFQQHLENLLPD